MLLDPEELVEKWLAGRCKAARKRSHASIATKQKADKQRINAPPSLSPDSPISY